jgi:hypothetical protein
VERARPARVYIDISILDTAAAAAQGQRDPGTLQLEREENSWRYSQCEVDTAAC